MSRGAVVARSNRLILVRAPTDVVLARLGDDGRALVARVADLSEPVTFPETWPGDALPLLSGWLHLREVDPRGEPWGGTLVERATSRAVGTLGCKSWPDATGTVEVGYGVEPSRRRRGLATEGLECLLQVLDAEASVTRVVAETAEQNVASHGVLRKCGFVPTGEATTRDGRMIWWERLRP